MTTHRQSIIAAIIQHGPLPAAELLERLEFTPTHEELYEDLVALEAAGQAKILPKNSGDGARCWMAA